MTDNQRLNTAIRLNKILANLSILLFASLDAHWNTTGQAFAANHEFFKSLYTATFNRIDDVAERIRSIKMHPVGGMSRLLQQASIAEPTPEPNVNYYAQLQPLWEGIIAQLHTTLKELDPEDAATRNLLEGMVADMEKELWMISANLS